MVIGEENRTTIVKNALRVLSINDRQSLEQYTKRGYSREVQENCWKMYVNGLGFRAQGVCAQVRNAKRCQSAKRTMARMRRSSDASMLRIVRKSDWSES